MDRIITCLRAHTDFETVYADDGTVLSHEAIVSCAYGKCDVEIDLD